MAALLNVVREAPMKAGLKEWGWRESAETNAKSACNRARRSARQQRASTVARGATWSAGVRHRDLERSENFRSPIVPAWRSL